MRPSAALILVSGASLLAGVAALAVAGSTGRLPPARGAVRVNLPLPRPGEMVTDREGSVAVSRRRDGGVVALRLVCPYLGCPLAATAGGFACPCHGDRFDPGGAVQAGDSPVHLTRHPVRVQGDRVEVDRSTRFRMVGREMPPDRQYPASLAWPEGS